jgi:hypothetical protein
VKPGDLAVIRSWNSCVYSGIPDWSSIKIDPFELKTGDFRQGTPCLIISTGYPTTNANLYDNDMTMAIVLIQDLLGYVYESNLKLI